MVAGREADGQDRGTLAGSNSGEAVAIREKSPDDTVIFPECAEGAEEAEKAADFLDPDPDPDPPHDYTEPDAPRASAIRSGNSESGPAGAPSKVGRYVVLDVLGMGGMGVVCTAYDPKLDRKVALKLLRRRGRATPKRSTTGRARLVREAQALAKLSHPNIVTVHDVDTTPDGRIYMAMEFVQGQTITQWLAAAPRTWREVLGVFDFAGRGLEAAHAAGITHRDFKPANVLIGTDHRVRVLDFGLAKNSEADPSDSYDSDDSRTDLDADDIMQVVHSATDMKLTMAGRIVGTPAYMAPEQRRGKPVGPGTDQFSFAVALYEALYSRLPFRTDRHYRDAARGKVLDPPKECDVPAWVFRALRRSLAPDPDDRYPTMSELLFELRADPARRRRWLLGGVGGGMFFSIGALALVAATQDDDALCRGAQERLAGAWDMERRSAVDSALRSTKTAYAAHTAQRVIEQLDAFANEWVKSRVSVCEATWVHGEQSESTLDVRMTCLDQRQGELRALVSVLADADANVVERAVSAVAALQSPSECTAVQPGSRNQMPADPVQREAVLATLSLVDDADALIRAGRYKQARRSAAEALASAKAADHEPTLLRSLLVNGTAARLSGDFEAADEDLASAAEHAAQLGDASREARATISRVRVYGVNLRNRQRAMGLAAAARSAIARAGGEAELKASLAKELGATSLAAKELDDALIEQREALVYAEKAYPSNDLRFASLYANLGITLMQLGEADEAETYLRRALELRESKLGEMHPRVASVAQNLANVLASRPSSVAEALGLIDRALEIREATFGAAHKEVADLWVAKARLHNSRGEPETALAEYLRAVGVYRKAGDERRLARTLNNVASIHLEAGTFAEAEATALKARSLFRGTSRADREGAARSELLLCASHRSQARYEEAEQACDLAVEGFREVYGETDARLADALLEQARVFRDQGRLERAIEYARRSAAASDERDAREQATEMIESLRAR